MPAAAHQAGFSNLRNACSKLGPVLLVSAWRGKTPMRIAQVAPLAEAVPPTGYGGTERVVSYLTEELVKLGHEVTLFATGDSRTKATLVPISPRGARLNPGSPKGEVIL